MCRPVSLRGIELFHAGTAAGAAPFRHKCFAPACGYLLSLSQSWAMLRMFSRGGGGQVESNERYYRRRAVEERMAARRAVSETARAWHAKLAEDFAQRAMTSTDSCAIPALINS